MPTLVDIEDLNGALEGPFAVGVDAALGMAPYLLPNDLQRKTPRVEITVSILNAQPNARRAFPAEAITRDCRWNFNVTFRVITIPPASLTRNKDETDDQYRRRQNANFQLHEQIVATLRAYASSAAQGSWKDTDNFPNHYIAERLREASANKRTKTEEGFNQTALIYAGILAVRESAWAALPIIPDVVPVPSQAIQDDSGIQILDDAGQAILSD